MRNWNLQPASRPRFTMRNHLNRYLDERIGTLQFDERLNSNRKESIVKIGNSTMRSTKYGSFPSLSRSPPSNKLVSIANLNSATKDLEESQRLKSRLDRIFSKGEYQKPLPAEETYNLSSARKSIKPALVSLESHATPSKAFRVSKLVTPDEISRLNIQDGSPTAEQNKEEDFSNYRSSRFPSEYTESDTLYGLVPFNNVDTSASRTFRDTFTHAKLDSGNRSSAIRFKLLHNRRTMKELQHTNLVNETLAVSNYISSLSNRQKSEGVTKKKCTVTEIVENEDPIAKMLRKYQMETDSKVRLKAKTFNAASCKKISTDWKPNSRWNYSAVQTRTDAGELEVVVIGGIGVEVFNDVQMVKPHSQPFVWLNLKPESRLHFPNCHAHCSVFYPETSETKACIITFGGCGTLSGVFHNKIYCLTRESGFRSIKVLKPDDRFATPPSRRHHSMAVIKKSLLVIGGIGVESNYLSDFWKFDISKKVWVHLDPKDRSINKNVTRLLESGLAHHRSVGFSIHEEDRTDDLVYTFGGINDYGDVNNSLWVTRLDGIDLCSLEIIHTLGSKPSPRYSHGMTLLEELSILVIYGGLGQDQENIFKDIFVFIIESLTWCRIEVDNPNPIPSLSGASICGFGAEIYIFGGMSSSRFAPFDCYRVKLRRDEPLGMGQMTRDVCRKYLKQSVAYSKTGVKGPGTRITFKDMILLKTGINVNSKKKKVKIISRK